MELAQVPGLNDVSKAVFETLGNRERFRSNTNISRFQRELVETYKKPIDENQLIETFRGLEQAGVGALVMGRNRYQTRFVWNYSLKDVAKAAKGEIPYQEMKPVFKGVKRTQNKSKPAKQQRPAAVEQASTEPSEVIIISDGNVKKLHLDSDNRHMFETLVDKLFSA